MKKRGRQNPMNVNLLSLCIHLHVYFISCIKSCSVELCDCRMFFLSHSLLLRSRREDGKNLHAPSYNAIKDKIMEIFHTFRAPNIRLTFAWDFSNDSIRFLITTEEKKIGWINLIKARKFRRRRKIHKQILSAIVSSDTMRGSEEENGKKKVFFWRLNMIRGKSYAEEVEKHQSVEKFST